MLRSSINVLLVEDNPTDVMLVRATLNAAAFADFNITHVPRLEAAVQLAEAENFDVILLDLGLPDSSGFGTYEKAYAAIPDVPIIILSGLGDEDIAARAVHKGAQDYLPKAGILDGLLPRAVRYAIERHGAQMELERYADELQRKNRELVEELRMAREIQQALLPHHYPQFIAHQNTLRFSHFYRPADALSGDFFNVLRLSDNRAGVLICDVMGHGVRAALIGTLARGLVDQFMPVADRPGEFLASLNRELSDTFRRGGIDAFATAFYFVADLEQCQITYANAGHPNALILHRDDVQADWLHVGTRHKPPLGMVEETVYQEFEADLTVRDSIILFTDGLYEAENERGERYGRQRLLDSVNRCLEMPCEHLLNELVRASQKFAGREEFSDDVCLVGMDVVNRASLTAA